MARSMFSDVVLVVVRKLVFSKVDSEKFVYWFGSVLSSAMLICEKKMTS